MNPFRRGKMKISVCAAVTVAVITWAFAARSECYGEGAYQVCSNIYVDPSGNVHVESYDTEGNHYSVDSYSQVSPNGDVSVHSYDSEGNSYSVRSWSNSTGVHSLDSEGNSCTILSDGTVLGC
jgi:hypothetical protein